MITTCTKCGNCYDAGSEEEANEPERFCPTCRLTTPHDHTCNCGTAEGTHETGTRGCIRFMTEAPAVRPDNRWFVDGEEITDYTLREQRGYYQHDCGCWSRWPGTDNSI